MEASTNRLRDIEKSIETFLHFLGEQQSSWSQRASRLRKLHGLPQDVLPRASSLGGSRFLPLFKNIQRSVMQLIRTFEALLDVLLGCRSALSRTKLIKGLSTKYPSPDIEFIQASLAKPSSSDEVDSVTRDIAEVLVAILEKNLNLPSSVVPYAAKCVADLKAKEDRKRKQPETEMHQSAEEDPSMPEVTADSEQRPASLDETRIQRRTRAFRSARGPHSYVAGICECRVIDGEKCIDRTCVNVGALTECPDECGVECRNRAISEGNFISKSDYTIRHSEGKGKCVHAARQLSKGELVFEFTGKRTSRTPSNRTYCLQLSNGVVIDGSYNGNDAKYINHACCPNLIVEEWKVKAELHMIFRAARRIEEGEELSFAYNRDSGERCLCGSADCSGRIGLGRPTEEALQVGYIS